MSDINQQEVFDRLPLTAEQRKRLYETITGVAARRTITIIQIFKTKAIIY